MNYVPYEVTNSNKVAFQRLVDLKIALIISHYTRSCNCRVVPTKDLFAQGFILGCSWEIRGLEL